MIYLSIAAIGLTWIVKYGLPLKWFREYLIKIDKMFFELLKCGLCLGFWMGVILSPLVYIQTGDVIDSVLFPFVSAAVSWAIDTLLVFVQGLDKAYVENRLNRRRKNHR